MKWLTGSSEEWTDEGRVERGRLVLGWGMSGGGGDKVMCEKDQKSWGENGKVMKLELKRL